MTTTDITIVAIEERAIANLPYLVATIRGELSAGKEYYVQILENPNLQIYTLIDYLNISKASAYSNTELLIDERAKIRVGDQLKLTALAVKCHTDLKDFLENEREPYWLQNWIQNKGFTSRYSECNEYEPYSFLKILEKVLFNSGNQKELPADIARHISTYSDRTFLSSKLIHLLSLLSNTRSEKKFHTEYYTGRNSLPKFQKLIEEWFPDMLTVINTNELLSSKEDRNLVLFAHNLKNGQIEPSEEESFDLINLASRKLNNLILFSCRLRSNDAHQTLCTLSQNTTVLAPSINVDEDAALFYICGSLRAIKNNWANEAVIYFGRLIVFNSAIRYAENLSLVDCDPSNDDVQADQPV